MFKQLFLNFFKRELDENPIVFQSNEYLPKVGHAISTWLWMVTALIALTGLAIVAFVVAVIAGWI